MERQAAAHQLASERSAAVRGAQLSTNEANVVAAAAREFLKSPSGDILAQRAHRNEKAEHLIDVIAIALNSTFSKYAQSPRVDDASRQVWNAERPKVVWQIVSMAILNTLNEKGVAQDRRRILNEALAAVATLAATDELVVYDAADKSLLSLTDRPWAALLRHRLSVSGLLTNVETVTPGGALTTYVRDNKTALAEQRDTTMDIAAEASAAPIAVEAFQACLSATEAERATACLVYARTLGQLMHDRVQHERWINALETGVKNDARSVAKFIALPSNDGVPMYDKVEADETEIGQLLFAAPMKPKADAAKKYVGSLSSASQLELISETAAIGDTTTSITIDPGSSITVIDARFFASLDESVAQLAPTIEPTPFAAWNGTSDEIPHQACRVAIRPSWSSDPHWVNMHIADLPDSHPDPIIWGRDAAKLFGLNLSITESGTVCSDPCSDGAGKPLPRVAVVAPDPTKPGLEGQVSAGEVASEAEEKTYIYVDAREVARNTIENIAALHARPDLKMKIWSVAQHNLWRSRLAPPPATIEPVIKGYELHSQLVPGAIMPGVAKDRRRTAQQTLEIQNQANQWIAMGIVLPVYGPVQVSSPVLTVAKYDSDHVFSGWRVCGDFRRPNKLVVNSSYLPPRIDDMLSAVSIGAWRTKLDAAGYYNQFAVDEDTSWLYAMQIGRTQTVRPLRGQFGMRNIGALAQAAASNIFADAWAYCDEIVKPHNGTLDEAADEVCGLLRNAQENNVVLNADKFTPLVEWLNVMGHEVGPNLVRALPGRLQLLLEWPAPTSVKQLVSFLAAANHYRAFIPSFALWAGELRAAAVRGKTLTWTDVAQGGVSAAARGSRRGGHTAHRAGRQTDLRDDRRVD